MTKIAENHVQSMTGFAQVVQRIAMGPSTNGAPGDNSTLLLELRSVNSRYLDLTFKVPDELRQFESLLREHISAKVKRGKVECRLSLKRDGASDENSLMNNTLDTQALAALLKASSDVYAQASSAGLSPAQPSTLDLLRWPGIWSTPTKTSTVENTDANTTLDTVQLTAIANETLAEFTKSRLREGAQTAKAMLAYTDAIETLVTRLAEKLPDINADIQKRFSDKVWERLQGMTPTDASKADNGKTKATEALLKTEEAQHRINQELVMMAMRADVSEEISRLQAHIQELRKTLAGSGAVGKKLDFLMQEFNREANTLGSKAPNLEVSKASTELKLAIEQIREQVQNLE
jgi:uncharacterized protein (TIGR00255 family)